MKRPPSLQTRIILRLTATTAAAIAVAYGWLWWEFESAAATLRARSLVDAAGNIADHLALDGDKLTLTQQLLDSYAASGGVHRFAVRDRASGEVLLQAGGTVDALPKMINVDDDDNAFYVRDPDGPGPQSFFGEAKAVEVAGHAYVVQVERLSSDYEALMGSMLEDFFEDGGWLAAPFLLVLLSVSILTIRSSLKPLRGLSRQAATIGPETTAVRLPIDGLPRELTPLVKAVNSALDRLEEGYRQQKEFTADAAHELRTPLAVLTAHVDTLPDKTVARALRRDLDGMDRLVRQLLRVAQVEALHLRTDEHADLCAIAEEAAQWLAPMAIKAGKSLELEAPPQSVLVHGNADSVFHALRNLVENALSHTPEGTEVTITVGEDGTIRVRDRGTGVPETMRDKIFHRFWRADRRGAGAGLGLSIVRRTMEAHGGTVTVSDAEGGGAQFEMKFPQTL